MKTGQQTTLMKSKIIRKVEHTQYEVRRLERELEIARKEADKAWYDYVNYKAGEPKEEGK